MRTVTSYLGHESVSMTLDTYADVDMATAPPIGCDLFSKGPASQPQGLTFTVGRLEATLAQARTQQGGAA